MHPLLERQLRKLRLSSAEPPDDAAWARFIELVEQAYRGSDEDRYVAERAMALSSSEMRQLMGALEQRNAQLQAEIDKHAETAAMLRYSATHDELTGLPSRMTLLDRLHKCIERGKSSGAHDYAVLFVDLDDFKIINDSLGHEIGDSVLIEIARRLRNTITRTKSQTPLVARIGGDEFVMVLEEIESEAEVIAAAEAVANALEAPFVLAHNELVVGASVGIAFGSHGYEDVGMILRDADTAMYRAKMAGKSRYTVFDRRMHEDVMARMTIEQDLRASLERNDFLVLYQPLVSLEDGRICGLEALARWKHPKRGILAPEHFIHVAEETGLIIPLGDCVMAQVFRDIAFWKQRHAEYDAPVAINISRRQLVDGFFERRFLEAASKAGVDPSSALIEITETTAMADSERAAAALVQLRSRGVRIHMDDFGTGYSSLSAIHQMPFDAVKIDRSFTGGIIGRRDHAAVVLAIITLAHNLGLDVIAEGIETFEQLAALQSCDCDLGQGFLFARPMDATSICRLLKGEGVLFPMRQAATAALGVAAEARRADQPPLPSLPLEQRDSRSA